jgi:DNA damage-binding protein 1
MAYIVSAHKPTSVRHAISCSFLSPTSKNLILAYISHPNNQLTLRCSNILQIYESDSTGHLVPIAEHTLHAKVIGLAIHKPAHYSGQDHLFILTDNYAAFTCSWDIQTQSLRNERIIEGLYDSALRPAEGGELVRTDPGNRAIGLNLYQGLLTFLLVHHQVPSKRKSISSVAEGTILEAVSLRMKVLNLINFVFLRTEGVYPFIVVLWKDDELRRFISVWEIDKLYKASDRDFVERPWASGENAILVDQGANLLIPTRNGIIVEEITDCRGSDCCWRTDYCIFLDDFGYLSTCYSSTYYI